MVFMTRVVYEFSLHDVDRERLSIFPDSLLLFLVSRGFGARPSLVLALLSVSKGKEETRLLAIESR